MVEPSADNVKVGTITITLQGVKMAREKLQLGYRRAQRHLTNGRPELFTELPAKEQGFTTSPMG